MTINSTQQNSITTSMSALVVWMAGATLGLALLVLVYGQRSTDFEQVTMAHSTTSVFAEAGGYRIHCADDRDIELCLEGARKRGVGSNVVMLGNSQVHAINQFKAGDQGVAGRLFELLQSDKRDLLVFSQPNANLQEHLVVFAALLGRLKIESLVLPVVFDDMREDGVRDSLRETLHAGDTVARLRAAPIGEVILRLNREKSAASETGAIRRTLQERLEAGANQWLDEHTLFWAARKEARGDLMLGLYNLRNTVFRIKPDTARPVIPSRYTTNRDALEFILKLARGARVSVLVYIAPIRQDAKLPYVLGQYVRFKEDIAALAQASGAQFRNWEGLVPVAEWGSKDATALGGEVEVDYMHFRAGGHERLAQAIREALAQP